jgi:hypothetical protein
VATAGLEQGLLPELQVQGVDGGAVDVVLFVVGALELAGVGFVEEQEEGAGGLGLEDPPASRRGT